jgi:hypothetical protein
MNKTRVAVVLSPEQMKSITGFEGVYGACLIDDELAQSFIFMSKDELMSAIEEYDVCPSGYSDRVGLLEVDTELEAIAQIADFALTKLPQLSDINSINKQVIDYIDYGPRYYRGIRLRQTPFGIDMMVGVELAANLGLKEGDKVSLKASPCSLFFAIQKSDVGPELTRPMDEPEHFVIDRVFSNIPLFVELNETDWHLVPYHLVNDCILISTKLDKAPAQDIGKRPSSDYSGNDAPFDGSVVSKLNIRFNLFAIFVVISIILAFFRIF